jgi:hypothetical protein
MNHEVVRVYSDRLVHTIGGVTQVLDPRVKPTQRPALLASAG